MIIRKGQKLGSVLADKSESQPKQEAPKKKAEVKKAEVKQSESTDPVAKKIGEG